VLEGVNGSRMEGKGENGVRGGDIPVNGGVLFKLKSNIEFFMSENVSFSYWFYLLRSYI
jgi:hypothetical protein